jgi:hypothetical protein
MKFKYPLKKEIMEHTRGMSITDEWTYFNARLCEELEEQAERRMAEQDNERIEEND